MEMHAVAKKAIHPSCWWHKSKFRIDDDFEGEERFSLAATCCQTCGEIPPRCVLPGAAVSEVEWRQMRLKAQKTNARQRQQEMQCCQCISETETRTLKAPTLHSLSVQKQSQVYVAITRQ
eukprot:3122963-Amphidinium_carterae.1